MLLDVSLKNITSSAIMLVLNFWLPLWSTVSPYVIFPCIIVLCPFLRYCRTVSRRFGLNTTTRCQSVRCAQSPFSYLFLSEINECFETHCKILLVVCVRRDWKENNGMLCGSSKLGIGTDTTKQRNIVDSYRKLLIK